VPPGAQRRDGSGREADTGGRAVDLKTIQKMTADKLRDELTKYPDVTGVSALKKDKLVALLCDKLGIDMHAHAAAAIDKTAIKKAIRALKKERDAATVAKDLKHATEIRHKIHREKHRLRRAIQLADLAAAKRGSA
jgi:hypothetical protein